MTSKEKMPWSPIHTQDDVPMTEKSNGHQDAPSDDVEPDLIEVDTQCGIGACKPGFLQVFGNMPSFAIFYGLAGLVTSSLSMYLMSQVTTLEKQFGLNSSETGLLVSMNDIGFLICVIPASHFLRHSYKPRILAVITVLFGLSAIVSAIPHFVTPTPDLATLNTFSVNASLPVLLSPTDIFKGESLCNQDDHQTTRLVFHNRSHSDTEVMRRQCTKAEAKSHAAAKNIALGLICTGMFFQGFAKSPRFSLLQTYIDDNVIQTKTGLYVGIISCLSIFGPAIAFSVGAVISRIYVTLAETDLSVRDPRWIGAWWLGFLIFGFAALVVAVPLLFFPRKMAVKTKTAEDIERRKEIASGQDIGIINRAKDMPRALFRLLNNFTYTGMLVASSVQFFALVGTWAFTPKYYEVHFGLTTYKANIIMGTTSVIAASTGMLLGGIITTKLKLQLIGCIKMIIVVTSFSILLGGACLFLACPQPNIVGLQQHGYGSPGTSQFLRLQHSEQDLSACGSRCSCLGNAYFPVCGSDGINYFSPCVAGCSTKMGYRYGDCACVSNMTVANKTAFTARPGLCSAECDLLVSFVVLSVLSAFIGTLSSIPHMIARLRCVSEEDKSISVGVGAFVMSLLGWTLGPVVFGKIIDSTCQFWHNSCSKLGACAVYDIADMRIKMYSVGIGGRVIGLLIFVAILMRLLWTSKDKEKNKGRNSSSQLTKEQEQAMLSKNVEDTVEPVRISSL